MANFGQLFLQVALLFVTTHHVCCAENECSYRDLKPQCGTDRLQFTHTNGSITFDIEQAMYPHGTKVFAECHRHCPGRSTINDPTGVRECRFGKWQGCFDKCFCRNAMGKKARCMETSLRRGFRNRTKAQWRRYKSSIQCCHICSLSNQNEADSSEKCQSFNLKLNEFGVECQFFKEIDQNPEEDNESSYFEINSDNTRDTLAFAGDCGALFVPNGVSIPSGTKNQSAVNITCNTGFSSIHNKVLCEDGVFKAQGSEKNESVITITCYKDCDELVVANGKNIPAGTRHNTTVNVTCNDGFETNGTKATCFDGHFTPPRIACEDPKYNSCILLIGGTDLGSDAAPVEYYHPNEGAECNIETIGNMSTERIRGDTYETSGCYLPTTKQVVVREKSQSNKPPMVYGLKDGSANQLPLPYSTYTAGSTTSTIGPSKCLSCGGSATATGSVLAECYQFDPSLDASKWTPIAPMPYQRQFAASVSLTENYFYLIGGWIWNEGASNQLFRFVGGTWSVEKPMSTKRRRHAAAPLSSTEFIICGGVNAEGTLSSCEIYDTTLKNWRTTGSLKQARRGLALISFGGDIYALGGSDDGVVSMKTVEKYDRPTGEWAMAKAIKHPRTYFVGVAV